MIYLLIWFLLGFIGTLSECYHVGEIKLSDVFLCLIGGLFFGPIFWLASSLTFGRLSGITIYRR